MALAEGDVGKKLPTQPAADFNITSPAQLFFKDSHDTIAIQVADLLAGTSSYCLKTLTDSASTLPTEWKDVLRKILALEDPMRGVGLNLVATSSSSWLLDQYRKTTK